MKDAEHDQARPVEAALENVGCVEHLQDELAVFLAACHRPAEPWKLRERLRLADDLRRNDGSEIGVMLAEKIGEALEIIESVGRPFNGYRSRHGLNAGVPQVSSQRTAFSLETVG